MTVRESHEVALFLREVFATQFPAFVADVDLDALQALLQLALAHAARVRGARA